jgi:hypothetical protein
MHRITLMDFLNYLNDPATPPLGIYPKLCKSTYDGDTCISIFIAALLTIAKLWNQCRCPATKKMWYIYNWHIIQPYEE